MKIYTVLSNHYDYYQFTDWIMTVISIEEVNSYLNEIKTRDAEIRVDVPFWPDTPVFFVEDTDEAISYNEDCASEGQTHIVVMVKEV